MKIVKVRFNDPLLSASSLYVAVKSVLYRAVDHVIASNQKVPIDDSTAYTTIANAIFTVAAASTAVSAATSAASYTASYTDTCTDDYDLTSNRLPTAFSSKKKKKGKKIQKVVKDPSQYTYEIMLRADVDNVYMVYDRSDNLFYPAKVISVGMYLSSIVM